MEQVHDVTYLQTNKINAGNYKLFFFLPILKGSCVRDLCFILMVPITSLSYVSLFQKIEQRWLFASGSKKMETCSFLCVSSNLGLRIHKSRKSGKN